MHLLTFDLNLAFFLFNLLSLLSNIFISKLDVYTSTYIFFVFNCAKCTRNMGKENLSKIYGKKIRDKWVDGRSDKRN